VAHATDMFRTGHRDVQGILLAVVHTLGCVSKHQVLSGQHVLSVARKSSLMPGSRGAGRPMNRHACMNQASIVPGVTHQGGA